MNLDTWQRRTEWPLVGLAVVFLVAYSWSVIGDLRGDAAVLADAVMNVVWIVFIADYLVRLALAPARGRWFVTHLPELALVALPMLRPLRLLRLVVLVLRLHRSSVPAFRGRVALYVVAATLLLVFVAGVAVLDAEQHTRHANIRNIGDALWWSFSTITSVGYGDYYPITLGGRLVAVGLMAGGVGLLGTVTALLAHFFVDEVTRRRAADAREDERAQAAIRELDRTPTDT